MSAAGSRRRAPRGRARARRRPPAPGTSTPIAPRRARRRSRCPAGCGPGAAGRTERGRRAKRAVPCAVSRRWYRGSLWPFRPSSSCPSPTRSPRRGLAKRSLAILDTASFSAWNARFDDTRALGIQGVKPQYTKSSRAKTSPASQTWIAARGVERPIRRAVRLEKHPAVGRETPSKNLQQAQRVVYPAQDPEAEDEGQTFLELVEIEGVETAVLDLRAQQLPDRVNPHLPQARHPRVLMCARSRPRVGGVHHAECDRVLRSRSAAVEVARRG